MAHPKGAAGGGGRTAGGATGGASAKVTLDEASWKRRAARMASRGVVRASLEANRGTFRSREAKVRRGYQTQINAERFYQGLTRNRQDSRKMVSGLAELNANFRARRVSGTGSTSIGVAASNRAYTEARRAKRAANKAARQG